MLNLKKVVNHKFFFNFVVFLSTLHIIMFLNDKSYNCILIFSTLTFIFNYFYNNPKIDLLLAMIFTNVFFGCKKIKEGFEDKEEEEEDKEGFEDKEEEEEEEDKEEVEKIKKKKNEIRKKKRKMKSASKNSLEKKTAALNSLISSLFKGALS